MDLLDAFTRLAVALGCGLIIGVERGWREGEQQVNFAGVRTFALTGLTGGLLAMLARLASASAPGGMLATPGALLLATGMAGVALSFLAMKIELARTMKRFGVTTLVAALTTLACGALAVLGDMRVPVAAATVAAILLNARSWLHRLVEGLSGHELRAAFRLLAMSAVLLPVLPDEGYGPADAINPFQIWLVVVLISAVSFLGYVAAKTIGPRRGPLAAAALGGLVSSTAVTLAFSRRAAEAPAGETTLAAGVGIAGVMMYARMAVIAMAIAPAQGPQLLLVLGVPAAVTAVATVLLLRGPPDVGDKEASSFVPRNPFDLGMALRLGALVAIVSLAVALLRERTGEGGLYALAFVAGLADVDASTLSFSRGAAAGDIAVNASSIAIGLVALSDTLTKAVIAFALSGANRLRLAAPLGAGVAGSIAAIAWALWGRGLA